MRRRRISYQRAESDVSVLPPRVMTSLRISTLFSFPPGRLAAMVPIDCLTWFRSAAAGDFGEHFASICRLAALLMRGVVFVAMAKMSLFRVSVFPSPLSLACVCPCLCVLCCTIASNSYSLLLLPARIRSSCDPFPGLLGRSALLLFVPSQRQKSEMAC